MPDSSLYTPKLNDRDVIRAFQAVGEMFSDQKPQVTFHDQLGQLAEADIRAFDDLESFTLTAAVLKVGTCNWQWQRLRPEHNEAKGSTHDKLMFSWDQQHRPERSLTTPISAELSKRLTRALASVSQELGPAALASHSEVLSAMESVTAKIIADTTKHRRQLDSAYLEKEEALDVRANERLERELKRVKEERDRVDTELGERKAALDEAQKSLDARQKELDDRNNTHVRRDIRANLMAITKERLANFSVSKATFWQYLTVHIVAIFGLGALAYGSFFYGSQIAADPTANSVAMALAIKSGALAATAIALGSWYLGWLNRWLQRIADAEFKVQQFRLDIERASWLAETVLEWKSKAAEPFPDLLASRLSAGLFQSPSSDIDDPKTPAAHLADALFGAASSAKLKLGEQELHYDRKSIKGLSE